MNKSYVCLGSCQAFISEEEYKNGLIKCGGEGCDLKGVKFVEGKRCKKCGKNFKSGTKHTC